MQTNGSQRPGWRTGDLKLTLLIAVGRVLDGLLHPQPWPR